MHGVQHRSLPSLVPTNRTWVAPGWELLLSTCTRNTLSWMTFLVTVTMTHSHDWANCTLQTLCPHQAEGACVGRMWAQLDPSSSIVQHFHTLLLVRAKGYNSWFCFELLLIAPCTQPQFTYCFFSILPLGLDPSSTRKHTGNLHVLCVIENLIYLNCFTARIHVSAKTRSCQEKQAG